MPTVTDLPEALKARHEAWKTDRYAPEAFKSLAEGGQSPHTMVISCCDSRVSPTRVFGATEGEFFVYRNIANFVPPPSSEIMCPSLGAAVEYGVTQLKVNHLIVMGHSQCGGVAGCDALSTGALTADTGSALHTWLAAFSDVHHPLKDLPTPQRHKAMEQAVIMASLANLQNFSFVQEGVSAQTLSLHGIWFDIASGMLESFNDQINAFGPI